MFDSALMYWRSLVARMEAPNPWEKEGPMTYQVCLIFETWKMWF